MTSAQQTIVSPDTALKNPQLTICCLTNRIIAIARDASENAIVVADTGAASPSTETISDGNIDTFVKAMESAGYRGRPVVLTLDSNQVLFIPEHEEGTKQNSSAYELETRCPVDAENIASVSFGNSSLVAIRDRVQPVVDLLERSGVSVTRVTPLALLYSESLGLDNSCAVLSPTDPTNGGDSLDLIVCDESGIVSGWQRVGSAARLRQAIAVSGLDDNDTIHVVGSLDERWKPAIECNIESVKEDAISCIVEASRKLLDKPEQEADFSTSFCPDAMSPLRTATNMAMAATLFLLISSAATLFWRAYQFDRIASELDSQSSSIYRQTLPDHPPTRLVNRVLIQKRDRLESLNETVLEFDKTEQVLSNLHCFLDNVPTDIRFETRSLSVTENQIRFEGEVLNNEDLGKMKTQLESDPRLSLSNQLYGREFLLVYSVSPDSTLSSKSNSTVADVDPESGE